jgi:DSF synthase
MDRLASDLDSERVGATHFDAPAIPLNASEESLLENSVQRLAVPEALLNLDELEVFYETEAKALWTFMRPANRPSFTTPMLRDFEQWQQQITGNFGPGRIPLDYLVLGSRASGVFCLGGDLELFHRLIRGGDRDGLVSYGNRCVEILHRNMHALDLPMITVGLVQGQALGGGFEALLSFDHIIAERGATFGLPEIVFGLFPGMGAHLFLSRKLGTAMADRMILSNKHYSAEDMYEMGIVQQLAAPGEGVEAVREFMTKSRRKHAGLIGARRAMRTAAPIGLSELRTIVAHWADSALQLCESDLKLMTRLASAQVRLAKAG